MSLPWSEMMNLINLDNELNPAPRAVAAQPKKTPSHRYNPYKKPSSSSKGTANGSDLSALHQWIDNLMQSESDFPEPDFSQPVACKDATGKEIKMRNAQGKNLIRPLRDYSGLFDPTQSLPEDPKLSKGRGEKRAFWYWLLQLLIDPSMREVVAWTGRGREFIILNELSISELWSRFEGRAIPVKFDSIRRTIRTHYKRDILIPADTKSRKNRRWAFYTEPSIHVGMTREELTAYITAYNTDSPPSSADKTIEDVPSHSFPTPAPSTESFFNFSAQSPTNSQFSHPPSSDPHHFNTSPLTTQVPEFSYPQSASPSHFQSPNPEPMTEFVFPDPTCPTSPITTVQMTPEITPEPVIDQFVSNIQQPEPLPVLDINEYDLDFDASWNTPERIATVMYSPDEKAKRKRREKNNESARRHRERTKKALEELRILKVKEDEWKKEYDKILNERNNLLHFLYTHKCVSSTEHLQQQFGAFSNATAYVPLYQSSSYRANAQTFRNNHEYAVEQAQMLPRPIGFCLNDYKEWDKPATSQNIDKPTSQDQSPRPKYTTFPEFLAANTGFTPASGRYTPLGRMNFWKLTISPLSSARGQPITPVFDSGVRECKKDSPLSEARAVDENK